MEALCEDTGTWGGISSLDLYFSNFYLGTGDSVYLLCVSMKFLSIYIQAMDLLPMKADAHVKHGS